ncbi:MAG: N-acetylglucosamine-6-phosphate deacetylase [Lentisphaeria bacterium]|jgi:N-acetylglucosamine-6-phosphate deacetylase|nr:N-acetylglucosamine-6-phosphate deacetylase [Lentisphaeria bacterium]MDY0176832.1 N-acetylglucosamine-6-phosphate deacetylase [Lentisphaeria bacterium]
MSLLLKNLRLISPGLDLPGAAVLLEAGHIKKVFAAGEQLPSAAHEFDGEGQMLMPGFIDIHCHGGMGYEATSEQPQAIRSICEGKIRDGVTSLCPTTLTLPEEKLAESLRHIEAYRRAPSACKIAGTHLEGPYINPECAGAQNPAYLRQADIDEVLRLHAISPVSMVTYAVEMPGSLEFTASLCQAGIMPSCGHSNATYAQFKEGMQKGLKCLTHFCNQMTKLHHREIGLVGAGFCEDEVAIEIICDKIHLCPDMVKMIFKFKPIDKILLISDAMEATGLPDGDYQLGGLAVVVSDGAARLASNGALAGSTLKMNIALKNAYELSGKALSELVQTSSWNQARELGLEKLGKIEAGYIADLVLLDDDFQVKQVFLDGVAKL